MVAELSFVNVRDLLPLTFPTATGPQLRLEGFATRGPTLAIPVPVKATVCGVPEAEVEIARLAERAPILAVLKRIANVQEAEGERLNPHDDPDTANSFA